MSIFTERMNKAIPQVISDLRDEKKYHFDQTSGLTCVASFFARVLEEKDSVSLLMKEYPKWNFSFSMKESNLPKEVALFFESNKERTRYCYADMLEALISEEIPIKIIFLEDTDACFLKVGKKFFTRENQMITNLELVMNHGTMSYDNACAKRRIVMELLKNGATI